MLRNLNRTKPTGLGCLLLPFATVESGVLLQLDGSLVAGWQYVGPDMETATYSEMAALADRLNEVLRLGSGWMVQSNCFRFHADDYPADNGAFPDAVTRMIDDERREVNKRAGARFESEYFLTLTYLPPFKSDHSMEKYFYGSPDQGGAAAKALEVFKRGFQRFENVFSSLFRVGRLAERFVRHDNGFVTRYDDLLAYYRRCLTHRRTPLVALPVPAYLNDFLALPFTAGLRPRIDGQHIANIAIDGFPLNGNPGILSVLDALSLEYRWSTRGILLSEQQAVKAFQEMRRGYAATQRGFFEKAGITGSGQIDLHSVECAAELDLMIAQAKSGIAQAALYSSNVVLLDEDPKRLLQNCQVVEKAIQNAGFSARIEQDNGVEAWLGTLPGDGYSDVRRFPMSSQNFAELLPLSSIWSGHKANPSSLLPPNTPPIMIGVTTGSTQFRLNLHVSDVGHFFMTGPSGAGKSTTLAAIATQWYRIKNARVIALDYGRSMWATCQALGGEFYAPGEDGELGFCPLQDVDRLGNIGVYADWIETLCRLHDGPISAQQKALVADGLRRMASNPRNERTLTHAWSQIQDKGVRHVLEYYTGSGALGYLFDAQSKRLVGGRSRFTCIETKQLVRQSDKALIPAMLHLFRDIETSLDGSPTLLLLDEAAVTAFSHPMFESKVGDWLLTFRKENVAVGIATQQLSKIAKSKIADILIDNCPTKIFLPNSQAASQGSDGQSGAREFYERIGLNEREIEAIRVAQPKRDLYITSPEGRRMVTLDLQPASLAFCGVNGEDERAELQALMDQHPDAWRAEWLRRKKLPSWADYLTALQGLYQRRNEGRKEEEKVCEPDWNRLVLAD